MPSRRMRLYGLLALLGSVALSVACSLLVDDGSLSGAVGTTTDAGADAPAETSYDDAPGDAPSVSTDAADAASEQTIRCHLRTCAVGSEHCCSYPEAGCAPRQTACNVTFTYECDDVDDCTFYGTGLECCWGILNGYLNGTRCVSPATCSAGSATRACDTRSTTACRDGGACTVLASHASLGIGACE